MVVSCNSRVSKPRHAHDTAAPRTGVKPALSANSALTKKDSTETAIAAEESAYAVGQASLSPAWSTSSTSNSNSSNEDYSGATPAPPLVPLTQNKAAAAIAVNEMEIDMDLSGLLFDPSACSLEQGTQQQQQQQQHQQQQWLAAGCSQQMFPSLLAPSALNDATPSSLAGGLAFGAHTTTTATAIASDAVLPDSIPSTATDAALDGWLQQFVNAEAIGGSTSSTIMSSPYSHVPCAEYSPDLPFSSSVEAGSSVAALFSSAVSPGLSYISPQSSVFPFDSTAASVPVLPGILPLHSSPAMNPLPSSSQSPASSSLSSVDAAGILDQSAVNAFAAAAAAAIAASSSSSSSLPTSDASISPEMLASVLSSAAGICSHNNVSSTTIEPQELLPPAASEISMLAALPFASIAMPMTNIAPQKTLSVAHADVSGMEALDATESRVSQPVVSALPLPPTKRQRRSDPPLNNINSIVSQQKALGCQFANVAGGRAGPVASGGNASGSSSQNSSRSNADASATASKKSNTAAVAATPENRAPTSVSPPRSTASVSSLGKGSRHNMVPLAPRLPVQSPSESTDASKKQQQKKQSAKDGAAQNKSTGDKKSVLASVSSSDSSRSGSSTPPGLSVLAKIAQKQVPIRVKEEEAMAVNSIDKKQQQNVYQGRLIAPSPANRQTRSPSLPPSQTEESQTSPSNAPDSAAQKRQERLIKNRAAALLSRKRKRDYMTKLESEVEDLRSFNNSLVKRLEDMERAMKALAEERDLLRSESATSRGLMSATSSSSTGAATSNTSDSASDSNNKNKDSSASEESTKEQKESSESNEGKGNGVEASDCAMDTDDDMSEEIQQQHTTAGAGTSSKQRTAGTLLMAMLFSFSLFTLPSLYTSSSQITAGGPQSAGIVPIHSLPSTEPRLLIGSGKRIDNVADPPLIERVRRSISALTQQAGSASPQQVSGGDAAQYANGSDSSTNWMRPMSMEESAVLHAWIRHGLSSGGNGAGNSAASAASEYDAVVSGKDGAPSMQKELERKIRAESEPTSLSVVRQQPRQTNNGHAMLYCPAMQHVVFSGDSVEAGSMSGLVSGGGNDGFVYRPSEPRVIGTTKQQASGGKTKASSDVAVVRGGMDDVDSKIVVASPRVGSVADWHSASHDLPPPHAAAATTAEAAADLVPTHAGGIVIPPASTNRPKLSLYSPVVSGGGKGADGGILPPWDEHARLLAASDSEGNDGAAAPLAEAAESSRQRYLRIDVEVVGSRWVTADKFAHGLY